MSKLDELIKTNPKAAPHKASIRGALEDVRKLREMGVVGAAREIPSPYKGLTDVNKAAWGKIKLRAFSK